MNWRLIVPAALALAFIEGIAGMAAYSSATWNWSHTEVLYRWDAVRQVCLIFVPLAICGVAAFVALFWAALNWATRGGR